MDWQHSFHVSDIWTNEALPIGDLADEISRRLKSQFFPQYEEELFAIVEELKDIKHIAKDFGNEEATEVFDGIWEDLYNWADTVVGDHKKLCWINNTL